MQKRNERLHLYQSSLILKTGEVQYEEDDTSKGELYEKVRLADGERAYV